MNRIKTSDISDPNVEQGFTGKSLDFLQNANKEILGALAGSMVLLNFLQGPFFKLSGFYDLGGGNFGGGVIYNAVENEIYICNGYSTAGLVHAVVYTKTITNDATADPAPFSDGTAKNVHNIVRMVFSDAVLGSGTFNFVDLVDITYNWRTLINSLADTKIATYNASSGWIAIDSFSGYFRRGKNVYLYGRVGASGSGMGSTGSGFNLPAGFRPASTQTIKGVLSFDTGADATASIVTINTNGDVWCNWLTGAGVARWATLTGIVFPLD